MQPFQTKQCSVQVLKVPNKSAHLSKTKSLNRPGHFVARVDLVIVSAVLEAVLDSGIAGAGLEFCSGVEDSGSPGVLYCLTKELFLLYPVPSSAFKVSSCPSLVSIVYG